MDLVSLVMPSCEPPWVTVRSGNDDDEHLVSVTLVKPSFSHHGRSKAETVTESMSVYLSLRWCEPLVSHQSHI